MCEARAVPGPQRHNWAIRYASVEVGETWRAKWEDHEDRKALAGEPIIDHWAEFKVVILGLYPGLGDDNRFFPRDLEALVAQHSEAEISTREQLGAFYRPFYKIS